MTEIGTPFGTLNSDIDSGYGVAFGGEEEEQRSQVIDLFTRSSWRDYSIVNGGTGGYMVLDSGVPTVNLPTIPGVPNTAPNRVLATVSTNPDIIYYVSFPGDGLPSYPRLGDKFSVWVGQQSSISNGNPEFDFSILFGVNSATESTIQDGYAATVSGDSVDNRKLTLRKIRNGEDVETDWVILSQQSGIEVSKALTGDSDGWRQLVVDWRGSLKNIELRDYNQNTLASLSTSHYDTVLDRSRGVGFMCRKRTSSGNTFFGERQGAFQYAVINRLG